MKISQIIDILTQVQEINNGGKVYLEKMPYVARFTWSLLSAPDGDHEELRKFNKIIFNRLLRKIRKVNGEARDARAFIAPATEIVKNAHILGHEECRRSRVQLLKLLIRKGWRKEAEFMLENDFGLSADILKLNVL